MVTGSGPSFSTVATMLPDVKMTRGIINRSTGGAPCGFNESAGFVRSISNTRPPSNTTGSRATTHGPNAVWESGALVASGFTCRRLRPERSHPPKLGKLALVGVEHEITRIAPSRFEDRPLALAQHHCVGVLVRRQ